MKMQIVRFGDLYAIPSGNGLSRPTAVRGEGYRMIGMGELFANDIINDIEMDRVQMSDREKQSFFVEPDDLLFARQSLVAAGAGKCSIVKELEEPTTYESHLIRVRLDKNKCNPWYYYYLFKLPDNPIKAIVNQCAQAGIRGNELVKIKVPLPPRPYQDRIVSVLSTFDNLIEVNNKRIKVLEQMAENLYKEWFVRFRFPGHESSGFDNGIPTDWNIKRFSSVANIMSGGTPNTDIDEYYGGDIPFYTPKDSIEHYYAFDTITKITEDGLRHCNSKLYPQDTIMITARGTVGNINLLAVPMAMNQSCYALSSDIIRSQYFLFFMIKREIQKLQKMASGGVFDTIIVKTFDHIKIVLPPEELINQFHTIISPVMDSIYSLMKQNMVLIKQRDLLLPRLMSGKLEV